MEKDINTILPKESLDTAMGFLDRIDTLEACIFIGLIAISLCLGILINRAIDRLPQRSWKERAVDYLAPLSASFAAILLVTAAISIYGHYEIEPTILPLGLKCVVAWFAIRAVMLMSSKRTAGWFIGFVIVPITLLHMFGIWKPLTKTLKSWEISIGSFEITVFALFKTAAVICILFWFAGFTSDVLENRLKRIRGLRASNRALFMKIFQIILYFIVFLVILQVMGVSLTALSVFGGALGVGLGFGLQKIASNFISGIILLFEKSIEVDDVIELENGVSGTVRHTGARYTLIETGEGKEVLIPNEDFITQRMVNLTYSNKKARIEIRVNIGYECDLHRARDLMLEAASNHSRCIKDPKPVCVVESFGDNGIGLILYFWVADVTDGRMTPKSDVMLAIWDAFKANAISIPYPQRELRIIREVNTEAATDTAAPQKMDIP